MIARIAAWLQRLSSRGRDASNPPSDVDRRMQQLRSAVLRWKTRNKRAAKSARQLRRRASQGTQRVERLQAKLRASVHEIPSPSVPRALLPHRIRTFAARAQYVPPDVRERALCAASPAYREASSRSAAALGASVHRMELQGLTWWLPVLRPERGLAERWVRKQRFPYRVMIQTRDVVAGGVMLDLGANIGRMSIPRVLLGDSVAAYCAEPDPLNYACLTGNVCDNGLRGFVLPDQVAIGDIDGTVQLRRTRGHTGHYVAGPHGSPADPRESVSIEVPSVTLDAWVSRIGVDLDTVTFIKVDVEGYECRVLAGAEAVLERRHIAWQLEVNPARLRAAGDEVEHLADTLAHHFTHFIDLRRTATGHRVRPTTELVRALMELEARQEQADVLVYSHG